MGVVLSVWGVASVSEGGSKRLSLAGHSGVEVRSAGIVGGFCLSGRKLRREKRRIDVQNSD